jgi:hypothetical protein
VRRNLEAEDDLIGGGRARRCIDEWNSQSEQKSSDGRKMLINRCSKKGSALSRLLLLLLLPSYE